MGIHKRAAARAGVVAASAAIALICAGPASAFQALPPSGQVNDDPAAGINPASSVSGKDPTNADVVGGALVAGKVAVPWAIFRQTEGLLKDQVFSRSFAAGAWTTRGSGTVNGRSSASPVFAGSLNFDQGQDGEVPAIDFAGVGRTVPWATWYEMTSGTGFANNNIFASRFDNTGDVNQGKWIFSGQSRGNGGTGPDVPSLNIHTNQNAENPSVAGGNAGAPPDPTKPGPWITWQETSTATGAPIAHPDQIFVVRPEGPGMLNCDNVTPAQTPAVPSPVPAIGGFCWQQTGIPRVGTPTLDPSLNIDPTRNGVEPDIAFTGPLDSVPWVVWYEKDATGTTGANALQSNEMVFAAKGINDGVAANGGFHWLAVGSQLQGTLDTPGNGLGPCSASPTAEAQCSLNKVTTADAEDPRVASGTMNPANPTVPWVAWDEGPTNGVKQVFVSRLVGAGAAAHFELVNNGAPISVGANSSTRPDITFSHNTPYVSWREDIGGGVEKAFVGHFVNAASPTFVLDESDVPLTPTAQADVREPISSSCTANPFNQDGSVCQGSAIGTPFFLFTNGTAPLSLFADAYQPGAPVTGAATAVTTSAATLNGSVNPQGASVNVSFQFGPTAAYGQSTPVQTLGPDNGSDAFSAALSALAPGTTIHYRAIATTDFGNVVGADQTLKTATPPPPPPQPGRGSAGRVSVRGTVVTVQLVCRGTTSCRVFGALWVTETLRGHKIVAVSARKAKRTHKRVRLGSAAVTIGAGKKGRLRVGLNRTGRGLLTALHRLTVRFTVTQTRPGRHRVILKRKVTFKAKARHRRK